MHFCQHRPFLPGRQATAFAVEFSFRVKLLRCGVREAAGKLAGRTAPACTTMTDSPSLDLSQPAQLPSARPSLADSQQQELSPSIPLGDYAPPVVPKTDSTVACSYCGTAAGLSSSCVYYCDKCDLKGRSVFSHKTCGPEVADPTLSKRGGDGADASVPRLPCPPVRRPWLRRQLAVVVARIARVRIHVHLQLLV